ncbi:MAG: helix-turn-helix transcriptional regulator [Veillonellaceae bacterium]|nr:helix-turn-helix transcriptional regulator [Veillonellaceae bacterium]
MIRSNLSVLLAQRGLSITQTAKETGISRTTLTALEKNHSQGVQLTTINTLCSFLRVTPSDLLHHYPVDIAWSIPILRQNTWVASTFDLISNNKVNTFSVHFQILWDEPLLEDPVGDLITLCISFAQDNPEDEEYITEQLDKIPIEFKTDLINFWKEKTEQFMIENTIIESAADIDVEILPGFSPPIDRKNR